MNNLSESNVLPYASREDWQKQIQDIHTLYESSWQKIAMELHDGACHDLLRVKLAADKVRKILDNNGEAEPILEELLSAADSAFNEVRSISHNLAPTVVLEQGLDEAIKTLLDKNISACGLEHNFEVVGQARLLPKHVQVHLYRTFQELFSNILRHAQASAVSVLFTYTDSSLLIEIADNGKGFEYHESNIGLGLANVHARIYHIKGTVAIYSARDKGTKFRISIPLGGNAKGDTD